ncbi:Rad17 cell cycle checkpoint protein-domain-containing protein [Kockovaella imperatae]|uniref:Rad17 cell cycle checkpoint protein-domain-containing protein n=1 Tax=Kockovaella imperatae TaxID=4999 RepID=A0A1Y1U9G6_9TREE|nr:Rad17 cell cycle checkpoint protein-domain-containing protein [Kockovaella imperatae]ORX33735.1 Rad17 cell cycle checkpoint protein-domain-containing protein [Kockovaella imperatae]
MPGDARSSKGPSPSSPSSSSKTVSKMGPPPAKKMGSLSSIQAKLNFSARPSTGSTTIQTKNAEDRKKMPPPTLTAKAVPVVPSSSRAPNISSKSAPSLGASTKDKGRANDNLEIMDDEDEAFEATIKALDSTSGMMWADRYAPTNEVDLAPGKARLKKVKGWLHEALYGHPPNTAPQGESLERLRDKVRKYRRILLLTGPAGAGKTTSFRVIAQEMGLDVVEWNEAIEERSLGGGFDRESPVYKLTSFLSRNSFTPLAMTQSSSQASSSRPKARPRILLLSSIPNVSHLPTKEAFQAALLSFCQSYTSSSCPLVIIYSSVGSSGRAEESWMDRERGSTDGITEILGKDMRDGPWSTEVDFLPLAPSFAVRALNRILPLAVKSPSDRPPASALQLIALTCNGDLRSAVNSLQLLCSRVAKQDGRKRKRDDEELNSKSKAKGRGSQGGKGAKLDLSDQLRAVLDVVSRKEQSLNLFHSLGKIFYNKRVTDPGIEEEDRELYSFVRAMPEPDGLPSHLKDFERSRSMVQIEAFIPTIPVDTSSFALWVHQSLPAYCTDVDQVGAALDDLCSADVMRTEEDIWQSSTHAIAYALHLTIRGVQMALPSPVPRNRQKIVKPQFFESYRLSRINTDKLNYGAAYLTKKAIAASAKLAGAGGAPSVDDPPWGGMIPKDVIATEMLPMMIKIQSASKTPLLPSAVQSLAMPPYAMLTMGEIELRANEDISQELSELAVGEEESEVVDTSVWVDESDNAPQEDDALAGDDIENWD